MQLKKDIQLGLVWIDLLEKFCLRSHLLKKISSNEIFISLFWKFSQVNQMGVELLKTIKKKKKKKYFS